MTWRPVSFDSLKFTFKFPILPSSLLTFRFYFLQSHDRNSVHKICKMCLITINRRLLHRRTRNSFENGRQGLVALSNVVEPYAPSRRFFSSFFNLFFLFSFFSCHRDEFATSRVRWAITVEKRKKGKRKIDLTEGSLIFFAGGNEIQAPKFHRLFFDRDGSFIDAKKWPRTRNTCTSGSLSLPPSPSLSLFFPSACWFLPC